MPGLGREGTYQKVVFEKNPAVRYGFGGNSVEDSLVLLVRFMVQKAL